jgi:hypothetical protein
MNDPGPGFISREWTDGRGSASKPLYYGNLSFPKNDFFARGASVARVNHNAGLVAGFMHGRALTPNQRRIFFRDLGRRMGDQSYRGPTSQWRSRDWRDWYTETAAERPTWGDGI